MDKEERAWKRYETVIQLKAYDGGIYWQRFHAMLIANGIIAAFATELLFSGQNSIPRELLGLGLSSFGGALVYYWWKLIERSRDSDQLFGRHVRCSERALMNIANEQQDPWMGPCEDWRDRSQDGMPGKVPVYRTIQIFGTFYAVIFVYSVYLFAR
ncbi:MAG: hypothetical protein HYY09_07575 [Firmicutes bacterium]|nr:hypothetical protein [Bacillota bacterium]